MRITGSDFDTRYQQVAEINQETGEVVELRLEHAGDAVRLVELVIGLSWNGQECLPGGHLRVGHIFRADQVVKFVPGEVSQL